MTKDKTEKQQKEIIHWIVTGIFTAAYLANSNRSSYAVGGAVKIAREEADEFMSIMPKHTLKDD
jgi:hypothetical protein